MTDDEAMAFAERLSDQALLVADDPEEAAAVLFQAGLGSLLSSYAADDVLKLLDLLFEDSKALIMRSMGIGEARQ